MVYGLVFSVYYGKADSDPPPKAIQPHIGAKNSGRVHDRAPWHPRHGGASAP